MSEGPETSGGTVTGKPKAGVLTWGLWGAALVGVAAVVYIIGSASTKPTPPAPSAAATSTTFASKLTTPAQPTPSPDYTFYDASGKAMKLADLKGKVVVMNIWATWCGPCVTEMPTLAKLQAAYAGKPVEVVTISIDSESSAAKARLFIAQHDPLKFYHDREMKLPFKLSPPAPGAPTTVIYGKDGMEVARVAGEADWAGPEARALVDKALGS
ncbi:MAG: TlpA family protein disulfide reductase [Phenylobacterium sp.]|uniref:TlpA family protein disulfide reductase n=1 Tax=Phenylobacterium sp. TaxID=1871053 RepID=UPI001A2FFEBF|nr:TlpA disulfide reductase family protein [Phenylobacterium sp.]MBJ7409359.1 TlpA family protein disulfide reductase [Phenylobacterium sp.]